MITLLLDSSNTLLVVGLAKDNKIIDSIIYEAWQKQSEYMILEINNILKRNEIDPKEVNEIIVTKGPGSYTGLRIALTIAKIYGYSLSIPVYAISSLQVLESHGHNSICLMNARSKRSYFAVYKDDVCIVNDTVLTNEEVLSYISSHQDYKICGELDYLSIKSNEYNILENMLFLKSDKNKVEDILTLKAIYLKD